LQISDVRFWCGGKLTTKELNLLPVEVVITNNAPYSFSTKLFKDRYLILKQDEEALTNLIEEVGQKSMANSYFRSQSLRELIKL